MRPGWINFGDYWLIWRPDNGESTVFEVMQLVAEKNVNQKYDMAFTKKQYTSSLILVQTCDDSRE